MADRASAWRPKPTAVCASSIRLALASSFFVVHQPGPTSFVLADEREGKFRVHVGSRQTCSCGGGLGHAKKKNNLPPSLGGSTASANDPELCVHILFVMLKALKVPPRNPLVWQLALTDRELDEVLRCGASAGALSRQQKAAAAAQKRANERKKRKEDAARALERESRRAVDEDETCPICYDALPDWSTDEEARLNLVWCRDGCGRNVHGKCMRFWADHQNSMSKDLTCPLCRTAWGELDWEPPREMWRRNMRTAASTSASASGLAVHYGAACAGCRRGGATDGAAGGDAGFAPTAGGGAAAACAITGRRFDCAVCASVSLCEACFERGCHPQHPFTVRAHPTDVCLPAERELTAPQPHEDIADALASTAAAAATAAEEAASEAARRVARQRRRAKAAAAPPPPPPPDDAFGLLNLTGLRIGAADAANAAGGASAVMARRLARTTAGALSASSRRKPTEAVDGARRGRTEGVGLAVAGTSFAPGRSLQLGG